jgi:hypothetical protein
MLSHNHNFSFRPQWRDAGLLFAGCTVLASIAFRALFADLAAGSSNELLWAAALIAAGVAFVTITRSVAFRASPRAFWMLLALHCALWPTADLLIGQARYGAVLLQALIVLLMLGWLFFRRDAIVVQPLIAAFTLMLIDDVARRILFITDPPTTIALITGYALAAGVIAACVLLALSDHAARLFAWVQRVPMVALLTGPLLLASPFYRAEIQVGLAIPVIVFVALGLVLTTGMLLTGLLLLRLIDAPAAVPGFDGAGWLRVGLAAVVIGYTLLSIPIILNTLNLINNDGFVYLAIAEHYAAGESAVRGSWSPMYSWLIAALIRLAIPAVIGQKLVAYLSGLFWVLSAQVLAKRFNLTPLMRLGVALACAILAAQLTYFEVTPDLLGSGFINLYLALILRLQDRARPVRLGLLAGMIGGLAYLAKAYNLPFFLAHLMLSAVLFMLHGVPLRRIVFFIAPALITLVIMSAPWLFILADRYGGFTIGTSGAVAHAFVGPSTERAACGTTMLCPGPDDVLFPWEDVSAEEMTNFGWSATASVANFNHQLGLLESNTTIWALDTLFSLGVLLPVTLITVGLLVLIHWQDARRRLLYLWLLLTVLLYAAGYMTTFSLTLRYYYAVIPLLIIVLFSFVQHLADRVQVPARWQTVAALYLIMVPWLGMVFPDRYYEGLIAPDVCDPAAIEAAASDIEEPFVGTISSLTRAVSYYTDKKTLGTLNNEAEPTVQVLTEAGAKVYLIQANDPLAPVLIADYGFEQAASFNYCGAETLVLRVPGQ